MIIGTNEAVTFREAAHRGHPTEMSGKRATQPSSDSFLKESCHEQGLEHPVGYDLYFVSLDFLKCLQNFFDFRSPTHK